MNADPGLFGQAFRSVPFNVQAEQALLGGLLTNGKKVLPLVEEILEPEHFYNPLNGKLYAAARQMVYAGGDPNPVTLRDQFKHHPLLGDVSPSEFFTTIMTSMVGFPVCPDYARTIRDCWLRRNLMQVCINVADTCSRPDDKTGEGILEGLEEELLQIVQGTAETSPNVTLGEAVSSAVRSAREACARGNGLAGISWGYKALDRMTTGLLPGNFYVLGARPAMGKTALGLGIAARVASSGRRTLFWSGEMTASQLGARAGAAFSGLSTQSVFAGRRYDLPEDIETGTRLPLESWQWAELEEGERAAASLPLEIDTRSGLTVAQLRSRARRMRRSRAGLSLIVLDYVGLMRGSAGARARGKYEETTEISNELKSLAKELDVPLVVLAQLNRESEKREDKRPMISDLRDSGSLEQDADVICLLHREHYYLKKQAAAGGVSRREKETQEQYANRVFELEQKCEAARGKANVFLPKNRHGPEGVCRFKFDDNSTWFRDEHEDERSLAWGAGGNPP